MGFSRAYTCISFGFMAIKVLWSLGNHLMNARVIQFRIANAVATISERKACYSIIFTTNRSPFCNQFLKKLPLFFLILIMSEWLIYLFQMSINYFLHRKLNEYIILSYHFSFFFQFRYLKKYMFHVFQSRNLRFSYKNHIIHIFNF